MIEISPTDKYELEIELVVKVFEIQIIW